MLTLRDCIDYCALNEEEIAAIAEHEHVPTIVAAEYGDYLCRTPDGLPALRRIILDDIDAARRRGDIAHMAELVGVLRRFIANHPEAAGGGAPGRRAAAG